MGKPRIYIAGPMRGIQFFNFPAFDKAKEELSYYWNVVSPADMDRDVGFDPESLGSDYDWNDLHSLDFDLDEAIKRDLDALQTVNAIFMLDGWQESRGAKAELAIANWRGLDIRYQTPPKSHEEDILEEALRITKGDRNASYGPPDQDFQRTAKLWSAIKGIEFEAREVAMFMVALKLSRETHQKKRDNWVDIAGYARCGSLCK